MILEDNKKHLDFELTQHNFKIARLQTQIQSCEIEMNKEEELEIHLQLDYRQSIEIAEEEADEELITADEDLIEEEAAEEGEGEGGEA